jgi:hypothetical protein
VLVAIALAGSPVAAQAAGKADAAARKEARKHFARGVELLDDGQVAEALLEFQRSYDLKPHFAVLYNVGQAQSVLGRSVEAVDTFERYLSQGGKAIKPARRKEVEQDVARQKARIATLEIRVTPDGAAICVDSKDVGLAPMSQGVRVAIGEHTVSATAEGYEPGELKVTVAGEDYRVIQLALAKHVEAPSPPPRPVVVVAESPAPIVSVAAPPPAPEPRAVRRMRIAGLVAGAAGAAVVVTGAGLLLKAESDHSSALDHCSPNCDASAGPLQDSADRYLKASTVLLVVGGAALVTGGTLYLLARHRAKDSAAYTQVLPVLGPGFAGLTAGASW